MRLDELLNKDQRLRKKEKKEELRVAKAKKDARAINARKRDKEVKIKADNAYMKSSKEAIDKNTKKRMSRVTIDHEL